MIIFLAILLAISVLAFISGFILVIVSFVTKKPIKRALYVLGSGAILSVLLLIGMGAYQNHLDAVEQARVAKREAAEERVRKAKNKKFNAAYSVFMIGAYSEASNAEKLGQKVQATWHDAIFNDNGVTIAGKQYTEFSDAIDALIKNETTLTKNISSGRGSMTSGMNEMSANVTYDTKSKLETALKIAKKVEKLASMATSPTGSYQTFGPAFSQMDSDTADLISTGYDKE